MKVINKLKLKNILKYCIFFVVFILNFAKLSFGEEKSKYQYIDINTPFLRKLPIAIPPFKVGTESGQEGSKIAGEMCELLSSNLNFTGYFKIIDKSLLPSSLAGSDLSDPKAFKILTSVGAELLVTGNLISLDNGTIDIELRLFDVVKGKQAIGKNYKGVVADRSKIIKRFCSEIIFYLTGSYGVFNSKIVFVSDHTGNKEVFICDFDGQNVEQFTHNGSINLFPAWSSDGNWIAYTSYIKRNPDIIVKSTKEKSKGYVIDKKGMNTTPAWRPGRFELAASLSYDGDQEIYLLTGDGKVIKRLTQNWKIDVSPTWSPDGSRIAFVSDRSGSPQVFIKDASSGEGGETRLTFQGNYNTQPSWSPKGDKIAYSSMSKDGGIDIFVISTGGGNPTQLTGSSGGNNESPSFASDGSMIVFSSTRDGSSKIYVMTIHGTDQRKLIDLPGQQTSPKWSSEFADLNQSNN